MGESILTIQSQTLEQIASAVGTPAYVYDSAVIRASYQELSSALADLPHKIFFSVKANSNLAVLRLLRTLGAGADIVSEGELVRVQRAGMSPNEIVFSGVGKTDRELTAALQAGIGLINVESWSELRALDALALSLQQHSNVGIRVNPDVRTNTHPYTQTGETGMKFGVPLDAVVEMSRWVAERDHLTLHAVGMHIGSQITEASKYRLGCERLEGLVAEIRAAGVTTMTGVGVGGGLGIQYGEEPGIVLEEFAAAVGRLATQTKLPLLLEPGRFIVGNAGYLLTRCVHHKRSGGRQFLIVDAGMNDLLRPSLYRAVHRIEVIGDRPTTTGVDTASREYDVVGPICETGDFLGLGRELSQAERGTLLAVCGAGAYGFSMSSTYNSRPRAAEVLVNGDDWVVIRERESIDDLMRGEQLTEDAVIEA